MTETIVLRVDVEDKRILEESSGMEFTAALKLLMDNFKYSGKFGLDPFWSEENQTHLQKSIQEFKDGKVVTFSAEEWEKFVNGQEI